MSLILYSMRISPPARACILAIRNLGLDVEIKTVDLVAQEHLTPEFIKLNPRHMIPVLIDGDFVLTESRAIMTYLANSRKPNCDLYPADPKKRAAIDEKLYFDATVVFERNCAIIKPAFLDGVKTVSQEQKDKVIDSMSTLEKFITNKTWFAGGNPTLADLTILANVTQIQACGYNVSQHENLSKWLKRCENLPGFKENQDGADELGQTFKAMIPNLFD